MKLKIVLFGDWIFLFPQLITVWLGKDNIHVI